MSKETPGLAPLLWTRPATAFVSLLALLLYGAALGAIVGATWATFKAVSAVVYRFIAGN